MYTVLLLVLLAVSAGLVLYGLSRRRVGVTVAGAVLGAGTGLFFWLMDFWGEMLWFEAIGYGEPFWTFILWQAAATAGGAVLGALIVCLLTLPARRGHRIVRLAGMLIGFYAGGQWGLANWEVLAKFVHRVSTGVTDPILGKDVGFYLFSLPFYDGLYSLLLLLAVISLLTAAISVFIRIEGRNLVVGIRRSGPGFVMDDSPREWNAVYVAVLVLLLVLAWGRVLDRYHLLYSTWGTVAGAGWTDVHVRLPAYWAVAGVCLLLGLAVGIPGVRRRFLEARVARALQRRHVPAEASPVVILGSVAGVLIVTWTLGTGIAPGLMQWLRVEPNEITFEAPYIANNIEFTRRAFNLHEVEEREYPSGGEFTRETVEESRELFENIRLWDWRALDAVYQQFQEIRLYYQFLDVDVDRYHIDGAYQAVMVAPRELVLSQLPQQSQTFVNRHFKYTHGYGLTLAPVSKFTPDGLPELLVKDLPPQSTSEDLKVTQPAIYYGEATTSYAIVNSEETEFDYPSGEKNIYTHYAGTGGVQLSNLWRKLLFGWKFGGTRLFLSGYPHAESRIQFYRQVRERVARLAPFLHFDRDPYITLVDGKLHWIIDAYTVSKNYPYSEPFSGREAIGGGHSADLPRYLTGNNYVRNSVKAVVDAYNGSVTFYVFDEGPVLRVWRRIVPNLFRDASEMPDGLRRHVRYPADMLLVQGLVYAKYHMTDPAVFYNQEDLWVRATEKYYQNVQPVQPYYIMWQRPADFDPAQPALNGSRRAGGEFAEPGTDRLQYILMLPFTPKNRQVLIGWIAGMCDGENYGRFLAYKFPKERRMLGPQQVETKVDQDPILSQRLTLWDQRGSSVIRGNVLAIPIGETLIYVEPIYLQAETSAYPELRLVVVMHGDRMSYAESFEQALEGLFADRRPELEERPATRPAGEAPQPEPEVRALARRANEAFENYLRLTGEKRFEEASRELVRLQEILKQLTERTGPTGRE